jgi:predicted RNA polymerase sigma factor
MQTIIMYFTVASCCALGIFPRPTDERETARSTLAQRERLVNSLAERGALAGYHLMPATRADLLRRLGRQTEAADAYGEALALAGTDAERRYLTRRQVDARAAGAAVQ